jgi:5'-nucleotidase
MKLSPLALLALAAFALTASNVRADIAAPPTLRLTILHTNDVHGHPVPFYYQETGRGEKAERIRGGVARRATLIRKIRAASTHPVILVDTGDTFTRGPLATTYEGVPDIEAMNAAGYEIAAIGNNEFKAKDGVDDKDAAGSQAALIKLVKRSRFPWVCANVRDGQGGYLPGVQPFVVREIDHVRVGFLGLTTGRSASYPQTKGWQITDPIAAAKEWIPVARKECDVLIALTHIGIDADEKLAAQTSGLDAIVGGDSHTFLYGAEVVKNADGVGVPIVQDGEFGVDLGELDLRFERSAAGAWTLGKFANKLIPVDDKLADAPDVSEVLAPYIAPLTVPVGTFREPIGATPKERAANTAREVGNALLASAHTQVALNPPGFGFFDVFRAPSVTMFDIDRVMPFHNDVATTALTGKQIKDFAAKSILVTAKPGDLIDDATYTVALIDYTATAAYKLPRASLTDTGVDVRAAVRDYFAAPKTR